MAIKPIPEERLQRAQLLLQQQLKNKRPAAINVENAVSLYEPVPLLWDGVVHPVRQVSYLEGLTLLRFEATLKRHAETGDPQTEQDALARHAEIVEMLMLFWDLLDPKPADNPFLRCGPWEVGQLLGFFRRCQTIQGARRRQAALVSHSTH